jgi:hypothetical protein
VRTTLTASGAIAGISMPVTIALFPLAAIPLAAFSAIVIVIAVWHLRRGRRITVRRTAKGNLTVVFDTAPRRSAGGVR